ncbi:MAG: hypothetical protein INR68_16735 [Methylobacterium mesophilicum]|nr:hypothetical protein [Methylobacterium mesophilicum]
MADPEMRAHQAEAMRRFNRAPENAGKRREGALKGVAKRRSTPEGIARMVENGRRYGAPNISATRHAAVRAKAGAAISAAKLRDVPAGYVDLYRELRRSGTPASEALPMVQQQARVDEERRVAAMTPFERQMEAVARGARVVAKPDLRKAAHDFTLGGVSGGML